MYLGTRHQQAAAGSFKRAQRRKTSVLTVAVATLLLAFPVMSGASPISIGLGTAGQYSVLAGETVTNTGGSVLHQSLGLDPGTSATGFTFSTVPGPGQVLGEVNIDNLAAEQAKAALVTAYDDAAGRSLTGAPQAELAGSNLTAGVYGSASSLLLSGLLILDGQGDPNSVFIFKAGSELTIASGATVQLIGNAQACNVFWQVGSSATVGSGATFVGTIMALESIAVVSGATIQGRALARNGEVTLDNNVISQPGCNLSAGDDGNGDNGNGNGGTIVDTGPGLVVAVLVGGLALLVVGGGTMVVARRRRADLQ